MKLAKLKETITFLQRYIDKFLLEKKSQRSIALYSSIAVQSGPLFDKYFIEATKIFEKSSVKDAKGT